MDLEEIWTVMRGMLTLTPGTGEGATRRCGKHDRGVRCAVGVLWGGMWERPNDPGHRPRALSRVVGSGGPEGEARRPKAKPEGGARRRSLKAKPEGEDRRRRPKDRRRSKPEGEAPEGRRRSPKAKPHQKAGNFFSAQLIKRPTPTNTENSAQRTPPSGGGAYAWRY